MKLTKPWGVADSTSCSASQAACTASTAEAQHVTDQDGMSQLIRQACLQAQVLPSQVQKCCHVTLFNMQTVVVPLDTAPLEQSMHIKHTIPRQIFWSFVVCSRYSIHVAVHADTLHRATPPRCPHHAQRLTCTSLPYAPDLLLTLAGPLQQRAAPALAAA